MSVNRPHISGKSAVPNSYLRTTQDVQKDTQKAPKSAPASNLSHLPSAPEGVSPKPPGRVRQYPKVCRLAVPPRTAHNAGADQTSTVIIKTDVQQEHAEQAWVHSSAAVPAQEPQRPQDGFKGEYKGIAPNIWVGWTTLPDRPNSAAALVASHQPNSAEGRIASRLMARLWRDHSFEEPEFPGQKKFEADEGLEDLNAVLESIQKTQVAEFRQLESKFEAAKTDAQKLRARVHAFDVECRRDGYPIRIGAAGNRPESASFSVDNVLHKPLEEFPAAQSPAELVNSRIDTKWAILSKIDDLVSRLDDLVATELNEVNYSKLGDKVSELEGVLARLTIVLRDAQNYQVHLNASLPDEEESDLSALDDVNKDVFEQRRKIEMRYLPPQSVSEVSLEVVEQRQTTEKSGRDKANKRPKPLPKPPSKSVAPNNPIETTSVPKKMIEDGAGAKKPQSIAGAKIEKRVTVDPAYWKPDGKLDGGTWRRNEPPYKSDANEVRPLKIRNRNFFKRVFGGR